MNTVRKSIATTSVIVTCVAANVCAAEQFTANLVLTSDYTFRGVSQTEAKPALQGSFDFVHDTGVYAGVWASNVESDPRAIVNYDGANLETDIYAGWNSQVDRFSFDIGALRYQYPGTNTHANNTNEYHASTGYDFQVFVGEATLYYSPDYFGSGNALYWDVNGELPLSDAFRLTAHYSMTDYRDDGQGDDYNDWSIGIATEIHEFELSLKYTDTSGVAAGCNSDTCTGRAIISIYKSL